MDVGDTVGVIFLGAALLLLIGHSFIRTFFARKEELINRMYQKGEE